MTHRPSPPDALTGHDHLQGGAEGPERTGGASPGVAFLFTGLAGHYVGMGRELYEAEPVFRRVMDRCSELAGLELPRPLLPVMLGQVEEARALLDDALFMKPALYALQCALVELWRSWGVEPQWVMGHSLGEMSAAYAAGMLSLEDGMALVLAIGRHESMRPGNGFMAVVYAPEARVRAALAGYEATVSVAAVNAPDEVVLSGEREGMRAVLEKLSVEGVESRRLPLSHGYHSPSVEPWLDGYEAALAGLDYRAPRVELISTLLGAPLRELSPGHWRRHMRGQVLFPEALRALQSRGARLFVEIGPRPTLLGFARSWVPEGAGVWLPSLRPGQGGLGELGQMLSSLEALQAQGVPVNPAVLERAVAHRGQSSSPERAEEAALWRQLHATPPHERLPLIAGWLCEQVARMLRQEPSTLEPGEPINQLGLDSLQALELKKCVETQLGVELPVVRLLSGQSLTGLAGELLGRVAAEDVQDVSRAIGRAMRLPVLVPDPANRYEPFPLTDIQQAYWIGRSNVFALGDISIHVYMEVDCVGLDLERLARAWNRLVAQHGMLRAIVLSDGRQQVLKDVPAYEIATTDLRGRTAAEVEARLATVLDALSHQVFPADQWPSFEVRASRMDGDRTRIHFSLDLLHVDGGSLFLLFEDWSRAYQQDAAPPPLDISFRDYVLADQAFQGTELHQRSLEYWREQVKTLPPAPELPLARQPGSHGPTRFSRRVMRLEPELWSRVLARCGALGLTPAAVLMSVYAEVLAAWSRNPRLTVNVTLFNRLPFHPRVNELVGDFTSMILIGVDGSKAESFDARVRRLQEQLWTGLEYRHVSGVQVLRELARYNGADSGGMPVVFTSLRSLGSQGYSPPVTSFKPLGEVSCFLTQTPQVWLDNQVFEEEGALISHWDAVEALFPVGMLDDMFAAWREMLMRLATQDEEWREPRARRVSPPAAQLSAREALNATVAPIPDTSLPRLLAEQAALRPQHRAVVSSAKVLTYDELVRRAHHLGRTLAELGARSDAPVAIVMEKGWEQVVAAYAIHSAGAPYLPVDPDVPPERLRSLLRQGEVRLVLTQPQVDARLSWPEGVRRLVVEDGPAPAGHVAPAALPRPEDLAYVLFTSGSTGQPKGVMIEHRSVVNRILDVNARFGMGPGDKALALSALHHDLSVPDIFGVLAAGGTLVIPDADKVKDPAHWAEWMVREGVTFWNSVPAFLEMLVDHLEATPDAPVPGALRKVILAGDWIPVTLPDRLRAKVPEVRFIASGGPTETTVWDIWYEVGQVDPAWPSIPYGKPLANARYHVLDEQLEPCPVWVPGQLYIGGAGLARGYWRDEEKTRASFITHPRTGERLYKSGDLGRWLPDGNLEFLGRVDFQVKINGQRIELGEIEASLSQHPRVRNALALVASGAQGQKHLVAYVVAEPEQKGKAEMLAALNPTRGGGMGPSLLTEPVQRLEFKLERRGVREVEPGQEVVQLAPPAIDESLYALRRSHREFPKPVTVEQLGRLLQCLVSLDAGGLPKYRYPSAGGLYPVRLYVSVAPGRVEGLEGGVYYHHPVQHRLVRVSGESLGQEIHVPSNKAIAAGAAFTVFLVGHMEAITPMYGPLARDFCLLEAGYMGQLLMTEAASCGIGLCGLGMVEAEPIRNRLGLSAEDVVAHSLVGGGVEVSRVLGAVAGESSEAPRPLAEELRDFLRERLPAHMVPQLVLKDALPLTPNGKVDRKALLSEAVAAPAGETYEAPSGNIESVLAEVVQQVLGLERVSVTRNFFDLGASSRHMVQILGKLRQVLGMDIKVTDAFRHPTIKALAAHLGQSSVAEPVARKGKDRAEARLAARGGRGQR